MNVRPVQIPLEAGDGHRWELAARIPEAPRAALLWLPALGIAARHYLPLADALAARGIASFLHEWRGHGSSSLRASHDDNWGYRALLEHDIPASRQAMRECLPDTTAIIGGHSLGGQLSACHLALAPDSATRLWLVGSGSPFPRAFGPKLRLGLPVMFRLAPWLAARHGALPGRRIGFGGQEAEGVMRDWATTGRLSAYRIHSLDRDLDPLLRELHCPIDAVLLADDWYAPESSLRALAGKMSGALRITRLARDDLSGPADHFSWMKHPDAVAAALAASLPAHG